MFAAVLLHFYILMYCASQALLGASELVPEFELEHENVQQLNEPALGIEAYADVSVEELMVRWSSQVSSSLHGLQSACVARKQLELGHDNQIALVAYTDESNSGDVAGRDLIYISLDRKRRNDCIGRQARLDAQGRIIWTIPGFTPARNYSNAEIVHPCIGIRMEKETNRFRPMVPEPIVALKECMQLCYAAEDKTWLELDAELSTSRVQLPAICEKCGGSCTEPACPLCRWTWHVGCACLCVPLTSKFKPMLPDRDSFTAIEALPKIIQQSLGVGGQASSSSSAPAAALLTP